MDDVDAVISFPKTYIYLSSFQSIQLFKCFVLYSLL